jgi:predicted enzyme related to lactoylglutathione lyase
VSRDAKKAQPFYGEVLGWKTVSFPMGNFSYDMIYAGETPDTMVGGYAAPKSDREPAHWISCVSVEDVDAAAKSAVANGGKLLEPPSEVPNAGRRARIADPQGAELYLFKSAAGDRADAPATQGRFFWNELHTTDPKSALQFYEKVVGFTHHAMDMGPGNTYHIVARNGVDRGGVTSHLGAGVAPHWLPYVYVDDTDATIARARKLGAKIPMSAEDIPGVGRFGIFQDPTGAVLAVMKPLPREQQR